MRYRCRGRVGGERGRRRHGRRRGRARSSRQNPPSPYARVLRAAPSPRVEPQKIEFDYSYMGEMGSPHMGKKGCWRFLTSCERRNPERPRQFSTSISRSAGSGLSPAASPPPNAPNLPPNPTPASLCASSVFRLDAASCLPPAASRGADARARRLRRTALSAAAAGDETAASRAVDAS